MKYIIFSLFLAFATSAYGDKPLSEEKKKELTKKGEQIPICQPTADSMDLTSSLTAKKVKEMCGPSVPGVPRGEGPLAKKIASLEKRIMELLNSGDKASTVEVNRLLQESKKYNSMSKELIESLRQLAREMEKAAVASAVNVEATNKVFDDSAKNGRDSYNGRGWWTNVRFRPTIQSEMHRDSVLAYGGIIAELPIREWKVGLRAMIGKGYLTGTTLLEERAGFRTATEYAVVLGTPLPIDLVGSYQWVGRTDSDYTAAYTAWRIGGEYGIPLPKSEIVVGLYGADQTAKASYLDTGLRFEGTIALKFGRK